MEQSMKKTTKICVVGTHGIGKTTLTYLLGAHYKKMGKNVKVINEVARASPFPLNDGFTLEGATWIICEQVKKELDAVAQKSEVIVCDRSAYDPIIYLKVRGIHDESLRKFATGWLSTYDQIIWVHPSSSVIPLGDGVRSTDLEFQKLVHDGFCDIFKDQKKQFLSIAANEVFESNLQGILKQI
jgi:thymidylate kinase